jgi:pentatricopeptide repeat protein
MVDEAMVLFKEMCHKNLVPSIATYNSLIDGLCSSGRTSDVQELLDEMRDSGQSPDAVTYNILLDAFCKTRPFDEAISLFWKIVQGIWPDFYTNCAMVDNLCKSEKLKIAEDALQQLLMHGCPPNVQTYTIMINAFCKDDSFDEAMVLLSKMDDNDCPPDAVTFDTIIGALLEKNETDKAEKLRQEMIARGLVIVEKRSDTLVPFYFIYLFSNSSLVPF